MSSLGDAVAGDNNNNRNRDTHSLKFLGDFAQWCYGVATNRQLKPLFTNQNSMLKFEQDLQSQVEGAFAEIEIIP